MGEGLVFRSYNLRSNNLMLTTKGTLSLCSGSARGSRAMALVATMAAGGTVGPL